MVEFTDLIYEKTGVEILYWGIMLLSLIIVVIGYHFYKYKKVYHSNKELYSKSKNYLEKVEEFSRKPMPLFILLVLVFAVIIEAMGFSYIFSDYILSDASSSDLRVAGVFGAILLAGILVPLTHITGEQIYYNKKISNLETYIDLDEKFNFNNVPHGMNIKNTHADDDVKSRAYNMYARTEPEIKKKNLVRKKYVPIFTGLLVIAIAVGSYIVRSETYYYKSKQMVEEFDKRKSNFNQDTKGLPAFLIETAKDNAEVQNRGMIESKTKSNIVTYVILMLMFIAIQVIGMYSGMNWGFIGKESKLAFLNMKNYKKVKE